MAQATPDAQYTVQSPVGLCEDVVDVRCPGEVLVDDHTQVPVLSSYRELLSVEHDLGLFGWWSVVMMKYHDDCLAFID